MKKISDCVDSNFVLSLIQKNAFEVRILKVLDQQWSIRMFFCKKTSSTALDFISLKTSTVTFNPQNQIVNTVGKNGVSRIEDPKLFLSFMSVFIVVGMWSFGGSSLEKLSTSIESDYVSRLCNHWWSTSTYSLPNNVLRTVLIEIVGRFTRFS